MSESAITFSTENKIVFGVGIPSCKVVAAAEVDSAFGAIKVHEISVALLIGSIRNRSLGHV